MNMNWSFIMST